MRAHAPAAGITDWGVGQVTLDTVFQRVVKHYRSAAPLRAGEAGSDSDADDVLGDGGDPSGGVLDATRDAVATAGGGGTVVA